MALVLGYLGLCVVLPLLLSRVKNPRLALPALVVLGAALAVLAAFRFAEAQRIDRALGQRVHYALPREGAGRRSLVIHPLPGVEGIHVSVVDLPAGVSAGRLRHAAWELAEGGQISWFDAAMPQPDDEGAPLFEIGDRPLKQAVLLSFSAGPEDAAWLDVVRLRVRPDWFSLKMLPLVAGVLRLQGWSAGTGVLLCLGLMLRKARRSRQPAAASPGN